VQNRAGQPGGVQNPALAKRDESWKGQSSYAGARQGATGVGGQQRTGAEQRGGGAQRDPATRPGASGTRQGDGAAAQRAQENRSAHVDRGYGESTRASGSSAAARPDAASRPERSESSERRTQTAAGERDSAFSGARTQDGGSFDRAASARGHASAGGGQHAGTRGGGRRR
jgi:hypothetical protein